MYHLLYENNISVHLLMYKWCLENSVTYTGGGEFNGGGALHHFTLVLSERGAIVSQLIHLILISQESGESISPAIPGHSYNRL